MSTPASASNTRLLNQSMNRHAFRCAGIFADLRESAIAGIGCKRGIVWHIDRVGSFCNICFNKYLSIHWHEIDTARIHRLSDDEKDFM